MQAGLTLKQIFDEEFGRVKFDQALSKRIYNFSLMFINMNEDHLNFFSGHLLGAHKVHFTDATVYKFFDDVLDVDYDKLRSRVIKEVTDVDSSFKISGDTLNQTCMYLIHRFLNEPSMDAKAKYTACYNSGLIFFYRCIAALVSHYFNRGTTSPEIAEAAFAQLNKKFLIKKLGSWAALMDFRAKALIAPESVHLKDLKSFRDDSKVVYAMNNSQGALRSAMKPYYREFKKVHDSGLRISSTSATMTDAEGKEIMKEKVKSLDSHIATFMTVLADRNSFIRGDLIDVIRDINKNTSVYAIETGLKWLSDGYMNQTTATLVRDFVSGVLVYSYDLIANRIENTQKRDYSAVLIKLKNLYLSTRLIDEDIEHIRDMGENVVKQSMNNRSANKSLMLSTRTSLILYITLRSLVMR